MRKILAITKSFHLHRALKLSGATAIAQVVSYAAMPILTRLFSAEDYSLLALFFSWLLPFVVVSTLRIEFSIPDAESLSDALIRRNMAKKVSAYLSLFLLLVLLALWLVGVIDNAVLLLLPLGVFLTAWVQVYNFYSTRSGEFALNSWVRIIGNVGISGISLCIGYFAYLSYGLVIGYLLGQLVSLILFLVFTKRPPEEKTLPQTSIHPTSLSRFSKYIFFNMPNGLVEVLQLSLMVFFLNGTFGAAVTGAFYLCWRILQAPAALISSTIFLSQYSTASELHRSGQPFHRMIASTSLILLLLSLPAMIVVVMYGPELFSYVFGSEWVQAGEFASILIVYFVLNFITVPFNYVPLIKGKQKSLLLLSTLDLLFRFVGFFVGHAYGSAQLALVLFAVTGSLFCGVYWAWYYSMAKEFRSE